MGPNWGGLRGVSANENRGRIQRKAWRMGPYVGADNNLPLYRIQSRLKHTYNGLPSARVDLNPMSESTLSPQSGTLASAAHMEPK
jgi:hypothetical protein